MQVPQNSRYNRYPYNLHPAVQQEVLQKGRELKRISNVLNLSLISQQVISIISTVSAALVYVFFNLFIWHHPLGSLNKNFISDFSDPFNSGLYCFIYVTYMLIPVLISSYALRQNPLKTIPFKRLRGGSMVLPAIAVSLALSILGGFLSDYIDTLLRLVHLQTSSPDFSTPQDPRALAVYFLQICILAPLLEEFLFRGVIMQNLRKFGNWFAVVVSALLFAMIHGNLVQTPFAFVVGIALGFFVIEFDSIWIGVAIHFCVNTLSTVMDLLTKHILLSDTAITLIYFAGVFALAAAGLIYMITKGYFKGRFEKYKNQPYPSRYLSKAFFLTPSFIVLAVVVLFEIIFYLKVV